ncbi:hypothetical protein [Maridesulfovibrio ferrireducens]|uniref:hypothetical protein n=1 Tax=Maridesulfovibrio ferrireducens TaxID=246191 RepID=UPI001A2F83C6|nr:hypothetical protein [Maridesulfovibrio ferrireducens]MBI9110647.1 hypothetical protein [Maridesulfovibrio ferrireducens]
MKINDRVEDISRLYGILDELEGRLGGKQELSVCNGRMKWPRQGVYLFFEKGEERTGSGSGLRVVRVGTHAVSIGSKSKLWNRLKQHKGNTGNGGGNHRGSIFRLNIGMALQKTGRIASTCSWGKGLSCSSEVRGVELGAEKIVSEYMGEMPFLYVCVEDEPSKNSDRAILEKNLIGLLSNYEHSPIDPPNKTWLGSSCPKPEIRLSGLWNSNYVESDYDPLFLDLLERYVKAM